MKRASSIVMSILLLASTLAVSFNTRNVGATGTVYIRADGSIDPPTAPISTLDNVTYRLTDNITTSSGDGIVVERDNIIIDGNGYQLDGMEATGDYGFYLYDRINVTIKGTKIVNWLYGIYLHASTSCNITSSNMTDNEVGISLWYSDNNTITGNIQVGNPIELQSSLGNIISRDTIVNSYVDLWGSPLNNITGCAANYISLSYSLNNTIKDCIVHDDPNPTSYSGIHLSNSNNTLVDNCTVYNNVYGIHISYSSGNALIGCNIHNNTYGLSLYYSPNNVLQSNVLANNSYNLDVYGEVIQDFYQKADTSNSINNKPVYYLINQSDLLLDERMNIGYLTLISCTNVWMENLVLASNGYGIVLMNTTYSTMLNCTFQNNIWYGIDLWYSLNNNMISCKVLEPGISLRYSENNNLLGCTTDGISLSYSSNNTIISCTVKGGISLSYSSDNRVKYCEVHQALFGVKLASSSDNEVFGCDFYGNEWGIMISSSSNNKVLNCSIHHNDDGQIYVYGSLNTTIHYCNLYSSPNPRHYGIHNNPSDSQYEVDARYCWWDSPTGPGKVGPGGGENVTLNVLFEPWLAAPAPFPIGDLFTFRLEPIQVIQNARALIMDKKTVVRVFVWSAFQVRVATEIWVIYDFGTKLFVEDGPSGAGVPLDPGLNVIYIPGGPARPATWPDPWIAPDEGPWLSWTSKGLDNNIRAIVDPFNKIKEANENNNEATTAMKIVESKKLKVLFVPVYFPALGESAFVPAMKDAAEFVLATYPVADNKFEWQQTPPQPFTLGPTGQWDWTWFYNNQIVPISQEFRGLGFGYDRVVFVLLPPLGFNGMAIGMLRNPSFQIPVIIVDGAPFSTTAHEIGHTHWLWHPHDFGPPNFLAQRFWVTKRSYESKTSALMSYRVPRDDRWPDRGRFDSDPEVTLAAGQYSFPGDPGVVAPYDFHLDWDIDCSNLYEQFRMDPDPEVVLLHGVIFKNGTVLCDRPWYRLPEGTVDLEPGAVGNYSIVLLNGEQQILCKMGFNVSFTYVDDIKGTLVETETDSTSFAFSIPYVSGSAIIEIRNAAGHVLAGRAITTNAPVVTVTYPNGGEVLEPNTNHTITWEASDLDGGILTCYVAYSPNGGEIWVPIAMDLNTTQYVWRISSLQGGNNYLIKVVACDGVNTCEDSSDGNFTITGRDIAISDVVPSKTVVGQGYSTKINVTVANQGDYAETFNVTLYASSSGLNGFRKPITITERSGSTLADYQVLLTIDTASLVPAGKMRPDCGDIRFTDSAGFKIPYWIESGINSGETRIWVKVPSIPSSGNTTIYMYYGNPSLSSMSDGNATFCLFDDFDSLDTTKWTVSELGYGKVSVSNGELVLNATSRLWSSDVNIISKSVWQGSYTIGARARRLVALGESHTGVIWRVNEGGYWYGLEHWVYQSYYNTADTATLAISNDAGGTSSGLIAVPISDVGVVGYVKRDYPSKDYYSVLDGTQQAGSLNEVANGSWTTLQNTNRIGISANNYNSYPLFDYRYDWIFVSKYVDPEPTFQVGEEEAAQTEIASQTVNLESGASTALTFTWNTTGFAFGNYTMSAVATIPYDADPADNTFVDGKILVTITGDINGDQFANAKDAVLLGGAFYPAGTYNPNADINGDDYCNAKDAVLLGSSFGQSWP